MVCRNITGHFYYHLNHYFVVNDRHTEEQHDAEY